MTPVLRLYFDRIAKRHGVFMIAITSILLLFHAVDLLQPTRSRCSPVDADTLGAAIKEQLTAFYAAYDEDAGRPKRHAAAAHLADT